MVVSCSCHSTQNCNLEHIRCTVMLTASCAYLLQLCPLLKRLPRHASAASSTRQRHYRTAYRGMGNANSKVARKRMQQRGNGNCFHDKRAVTPAPRNSCCIVVFVNTWMMTGDSVDKRCTADTIDYYVHCKITNRSHTVRSTDAGVTRLCMFSSLPTIGCGSRFRS